MDINYDTIIKYLCKEVNKNVLIDNTKLVTSNNNQPFQFITQKNLLTYSKNFPTKFKDYLNDNFYRYGITIYDNENNNISFWSSLLTLLDKQFIIPYANDEISTINKIKGQFIEKYDKAILSPALKGFDKNDLKERFKLEPDCYILQYIIDILEINFLIFDFDTIDILTLYCTDIMNPWKQTLIFAKHKNFWEPIMATKAKGINKRYFDANDNNIKKLLTNDIKYYEEKQLNKTTNIQNNILDIIIAEKNIRHKFTINENLLLNESDSQEKSDDKNIFIKEDINEKIKLLNKTKLNKMKVKELYDLTEELKLNLKKKSTKQDMINNILLKISPN